MARVSSPHKAMRVAKAAAAAIGVSRQTLYRYENVSDDVPAWVIRRAAEVYGVPLAELAGDGTGRVHPTSVAEPSVPYVTAVAPVGRTFASEAERISYALGVLDMASTSNRLVLETSNEVSRAISAASAALLAPISEPAPAAPVKSDAEYIAESTAALAAAAAAPVKPASKPRRASGR